MKKMVIYLAASLLTFTIGVTCAMSPRVITVYRAQALRSREAVLRAELFQMHKAIGQYAAEKGTPPRSLIQIVEAGYMHDIPVDPITELKDWDEEVIDLRGQFDILILRDVHSLSQAISSEGTPYNEW